MTTTEEQLPHGPAETESSACADPANLGHHDPREAEAEPHGHPPLMATGGDSDPRGIGRDLEDMFHDCAVSCHDDSTDDIFNAPPLTGGPILRDDVRSEDSDDFDIFNNSPPLTGGPILSDDVRSLNSDDYVDQEDECDKFAHMETNCPARIRNIPRQMAKKIWKAWLTSIVEQNEQYAEKRAEILRQDEDADLPPFPLEVFPEAAGVCVERGFCHHLEYRTHDTSTTESTLRYGEPEQMLQIFSLRLSSFSVSCPIRVYGVFAVRDVLEPLRNHVFNRSRDDPVTVDQDPFTLPLCSPCRGMYLPYDQALLEVDLWIKKEGDGSADQQLLSAYVELDVHVDIDRLIYGCIPWDTGSLEIDYAYLSESFEAEIEVSAEVSRPLHVRFAAFSSGYYNEIVMFDDKFFGRKVFKHVVAVKAEGELNVRLELEKSLFQWTFQDGNVGALSSPDDSILQYGQFHVRVCFAPKKCE